MNTYLVMYHEPEIERVSDPDLAVKQADFEGEWPFTTELAFRVVWKSVEHIFIAENDERAWEIAKRYAKPQVQISGLTLTDDVPIKLCRLVEVEPK